MVELYGKKYTRKQLSRYAADLSQVGSVRPFAYTEGPARGMAGFDVRSGSGLCYTVVAGRGLDLSTAEWCGIPFAFRSAVGDRHPAYFEPEDFRWVRTFGGGLLATCGLDQIGMPGEDQGDLFGLHGRYTSLAAERVSWDEEWKGNQCTLFIEGRVRQAALFREHLILHRRIETPLGENRIRIRDRVENAGQRKQPHMILYHFNFGFPLLDEGTRLHAPAVAIVPRDEEAARGLERAMVMEGPADRGEQCYFYTMKPRRGVVEVALVNSGLGPEGVFGVSLRYKAETLPYFTQWKCLASGTYVCGLEPSNCELLGREEARRQGKIINLRPGEVVEYDLEVEVLSSKEAVKKAIKRIEG
jgi:hypothetical protein